MIIAQHNSSVKKTTSLFLSVKRVQIDSFFLLTEDFLHVIIIIRLFQKKELPVNDD